MAEIKKKKASMFDTPYTLKNAFAKGDIFVRLSCVIMGLGNMVRKQVIKGLLYFLIEVAYIWFMVQKGVHNLAMLPSLGTVEQNKVWDEDQGIFVYTAGDNSVLILLAGIATLLITFLFACIWIDQMKSGYKALYLTRAGKHVNNFIEDIKSLANENIHKFLMFFPMLGIIFFTILPLLFMIPMAFTNYSKIGKHLVLFDWVGLENFKRVLGMGGKLGSTFWPVLGWTLVWAFFATFLNFFLGMLLAMVINRKDTKGKSVWRFIFVLSIAVPQFVSLLLMRTMFSQNGPINNMLINAGIVSKAVPFWTNAGWARFMVIVINCWIGIPYSMLQVTGILQNIPSELTEAARIDGANSVQTFFKITLPYIMFIMGPYIITQFTGNINNFNVIYLLSGGNPTPVGSTAGKTDLLVTWLYKLTIDYQYYNLGAVIGIITFIVLSIVALATYRNTASYKDEEAFN